MKVLKIILLILWMMIIFAFSNQKAVDSSNLSSGLIDRTVVKVYKVFYGDISKEKEEVIIEKYSYPIRKLAHYSLYFILGILSFLVIVDYKTDFVNDENKEEVINRYKKQLDLYAEVVENLTGKEVKEKCIYLFSIDEEVSI